jgi:hypothetical protein
MHACNSCSRTAYPRLPLFFWLLPGGIQRRRRRRRRRAGGVKHSTLKRLEGGGGGGGGGGGELGRYTIRQQLHKLPAEATDAVSIKKGMENVHFMVVKKCREALEKTFEKPIG